MAGSAASMARKIACILVIVCMVIMAARPQVVEAITCGQVVNSVLPCLGYLRTGKGLGPRCCAGVKTLKGLASTTPDLRTACSCLKNAAASLGVVNYEYASSLPAACGVNLAFKISPSLDCSKIQ